MTDKERMLASLAEESDMVLATAYVYAVNAIKFGKDVTKQWLTAVQQACALNEAYVRGRIDSDKEWRERLTKPCKMEVDE